VRIKGKYILYGINILTAILFVIIAFLPNNTLRVVIGLPVIIFFPGYTLFTALLPGRGRLDSIERVVFSFGLSLAIVPVIGLLLNYSPWGIHLYPIMISLFGFIFSMSTIGWYRERQLSEEERISLNIKMKFPQLIRLWSSQNTTNKIFSGLLVVLIFGSLGVMGYIISLPKYGTKYTEFYFPEKITGPQTIIEGQPSTVFLEIVNHEKATETYRLEITIDGGKIQEIDNVNLSDEAKWEQNVAFTPTQTGTNQKIAFLLYQGNGTSIYGQLTLWVNVVASS